MRLNSIFDDEKLARDERVQEIQLAKATLAGLRAVANVVSSQGFTDFVAMLRTQRAAVERSVIRAATDRDASIAIGGLRAYDHVLATLSDSGKRAVDLEVQIKQMEDQLRAADDLVRRRNQNGAPTNDLSQPR